MELLRYCKCIDGNPKSELLLSGEIAKDVKEFQKTIEEEKARK